MRTFLTTQLLFLFALIKQIIPVGVITADVTLPIKTTLANQLEYSDYTFRFNLSTKLVQGGYVKVIFPSQYQDGLGIPFLANCTITCDRFEREIKFFFNEDLFPGISKKNFLFLIFRL